MIHAIGRVMLYVQDPKKAAEFWIEKMGFVKIEERPAPGRTVSIEIAPTLQADTRFVLYNKEMIAKYEPGLTLGIPSILLSCENLEETNEQLKEKGVHVGEIVVMQGVKTFNFADNEGNYFAVREA